jgi:hypothetical protein
VKHTKRFALLALMAATLTASVGASAASASRFETVGGNYPAFVSAEMSGTGMSFASSVGTVECENGSDFETTLEGHTNSIVPSAQLNATCANGSGTLKMNGCRFEYGLSAGLSGSFSIGPPGCGAVTLTYTPLGSVCTYSFAPQSTSGAQYENLESGELAITVSGSLQFTHAGSQAACGKSPGSMSIAASWVAAAQNEVGEGLDLIARDDVGLYLAGAESESEAAQPRIEAEIYPTPVSGAQAEGDKHALAMVAGTVGCAGVLFTGEVGGATQNLPLAAQYSNCSVVAGPLKGAPVEVSMNSCSYELGVLNIGPPYAGDMSITCTKGGDTVQVKFYASKEKQEAGTSLCTLSIAPQGNLNGVGLSTVGEGFYRGVSLDLGLGGIKYIRTGSILCGKAEGVASYMGTTTLFGSL